MTTAASGRCRITAIETIAAVQVGFRQYPQIHVLPCGDWVVTFAYTEDAYFGRSALLRSTNHGETWAEETWATDSGTIVPLSNNRVGIFDSFYALNRGADRFAVQACFSEDGGKTFGQPQLSVPVTCPQAEVYSLEKLINSYFALPCFAWSKFFKANGYPAVGPGWPGTAEKIRFGGAGPTSSTLQLWNGKLLSMSYCRSNFGPRFRDGFYTAIALLSADNGNSWRQVGTVPWTAATPGATTPFGTSGFTEAALATNVNNELVALLRAGSGLPLAMSTSTDDGVTWSQPSVVTPAFQNEPIRGVSPAMIRMKNGTLVAAYGRPGVHVIVDRSGTGSHWMHAVDLIAIERAQCHKLGAKSADFVSTENVGLAEVADGEIAVTYDLANWQEAAGKPVTRQAIRLARIRVE